MEKGWIYSIIVTAILLLIIGIFLFKRFRRKKEKKLVKPEHVFLKKLEMFSVIVFIFSLFLLDVNANMLMAYGKEVMVTVFGDIFVASTSMFWLGFLIGLASFLTFTMTSIVMRKGALKKLDVFFAIIGGVGLGIILSGGLLVFGEMGELTTIPFFFWTLSRATYYHIGIGLEILTVLYFTLTR